jgi:hypothetical protein
MADKVEEVGMNAARTQRAGAGGKRLGERRCPACNSTRVRRSQMRGLLERGLLKPLGVKAYRCEDCDARFYRFGSRSQVHGRSMAGSNGGIAN